MSGHDTHECPECGEFMEWVADYLDGEETLEVRQQLMVHAHSCTDCARLLWSMKRVVRVCHSETGCEVPGDVHKRLWDALTRELGIDQD